ncbi:MAG: asparagine synthase-related protein [Candidatus Omnitrophica bacterium]|nr:asparagine synthase-related protein [Candidatus Omnitrophota bacterium]
MAIFGFSEDNPGLLDRMTGYLKGQKPGKAYKFCAKNICLAYADKLHNGDPRNNFAVCDGKKTIALILEGHIYNTRDFAAESIIWLYKEYGLDFIKRLEGEFTFVLYDSLAGKLIFYRDEFGTKPLYYSYKNGKIIFASEIKAIFRHPLKREFNLEALVEQSILGFTYNDKTIFSGIYSLPAGIPTLFDLKTQAFSYPSYRPKKGSRKNNLTELEIIQRTEKLIVESSQRKIASEKEIGLYLSGGVDSTLIADIIRNNKIRVNAYSLKGQKNRADLFYAAKNAQKYGFQHQIIAIKETEALRFLPAACYHVENIWFQMAKVYLFLHKIKGNQRVNLWGIGTEEFFKGLASHINQEGFRNYLTNRITKKYPQAKIVLPWAQEMLRHPAKIMFDEIALRTLLYQIRLIYQVSASVNQEARFPYLSQKIRNFLEQIPQKLHTQNANPKYIIRQIAKTRGLKYNNRFKLGFDTSLDMEVTAKSLRELFPKIKPKLKNLKLFSGLKFNAEEIICLDILDRVMLKETNHYSQDLQTIYRI